MCTSWKGWISAAIHIAPEVEEASLISALALWHADLEKVGKHLASDFLNSEKSLSGTNHHLHIAAIAPP